MSRSTRSLPRLVPPLYFYLLACALYVKYAVAPALRALLGSESWPLGSVTSPPTLLFAALTLGLGGFLIYYPRALARAVRRGDAWWRTPVVGVRVGSLAVGAWLAWLALAHAIGLA